MLSVLPTLNSLTKIYINPLNALALWKSLGGVCRDRPLPFPVLGRYDVLGSLQLDGLKATGPILSDPRLRL